MSSADQSICQSPDSKRSRAAYCMECTAEYFLSLLVTDSFLAVLPLSAAISSVSAQQKNSRSIS